MVPKPQSPQLKGLLNGSNLRRSPLLPLQRPLSASPSSIVWRKPSLSHKRSAFLFVSISSVIVLLINTAHIQFSIRSLSLTDQGPQAPAASTIVTGSRGQTSVLHDYGYEYESSPQDRVIEQPHPYNDNEYDDEKNGDIDDEEWRFSEDELEEHEEEGDEDETRVIQRPRRPPPARAPPKIIEGVIPAHCPRLFLSTEMSVDLPSYTSSSTVPLSSAHSTATVLEPSDVNCRLIPSQLPDYSLAFCISNEDCSRGFIQIMHDITNVTSKMANVQVSRNARHDQYFRKVAGPDDFYFVLEGAQKLALSAHLVSDDLFVNMGDSIPSPSPIATPSPHRLVYRADFRMTLPGPVQISGWLTYEKFRAVRENHPGIWPQWSHIMLIDPETSIDSTKEKTPSSSTSSSNFTDTGSTKFIICPSCKLDPFLEQLKRYRENGFEQCDRMAPVRGSYWEEELALKIYSDMDTINKSPGAGAYYETNENTEEPEVSKSESESQIAVPPLTRGWRFVPNGCTMTKTTSQPNASSQDPFLPTCDSIASPAAAMLSRSFDPTVQINSKDDKSKGQKESSGYPVRRILFTGDSQVRTTYNAILNHYRPKDAKRQRFSNHEEFLPGLRTLEENNMMTTAMPTSAVRASRLQFNTEIELIYKADQFLDFLVSSSDQELDRYDTIYLNLGQWPASGPVAGGQWSTAKFLNRWKEVLERLDRWKRSREEARSRYSDDEMVSQKDPTVGSGSSSRVVWAGMNAFPMRTDPSIREKGDWRTNARLGYWDDWVETVSQEEGGWFRRINAWQLTFPMLDQVVDKAHFQETDAIDALKIEALYKLDLCSRMSADVPYSYASGPSESQKSIQKQHTPVMDRMPIEIILTFGRRLDGPSLVSSLLVCRQWYDVLRPLVWFSITKLQWHHVAFPLVIKWTIEHNIPLQENLHLVRHLEWVPTYQLTGLRKSFRKQLSQDTLASLFRYTTLLDTLELKIPRSLFYPSLRTLSELRSLRRLDIEVLDPPFIGGMGSPVNLVQMFPVFSQLEDLNLNGDWYSWTPPQDHEGPLRPIETSWRMKRLSVDLKYLALSRFCPELRELSLRSVHPALALEKSPISIRHLATCPKLEALEIRSHGHAPLFENQVEVLSSLRGLKRLRYYARSIEDVEFLCASDDHVFMPTIGTYRGINHSIPDSASGSGVEVRSRHKDESLTLPLLEHYEVTSYLSPDNVSQDSRLRRAFSNMLATRPALKTFIVRRTEFDPEELFPELENDEWQEWVCKDLEILSLEFKWTLHTLPLEERLRLWRPVYRQIGTLSKLKALLIWCTGLEKSPESGIGSLAGASNLARLVLSDESNAFWTEDELLALVRMLPKLSTLCLRPLKNAGNVYQWLAASGRHVEFTTFDVIRQLLDKDRA
ncbi:hypothetical protein BGX28_007368 [Mortierella sp. GBA30]|nr:hypothetical protein BGX28_007368 [Mortierella sp. GBA30]